MISKDKYLKVIFDCIDNLDYDENVKNLFKEALNFELNSPNNIRYSNEYKKFLNRHVGD